MAERKAMVTSTGKLMRREAGLEQGREQGVGVRKCYQPNRAYGIINGLLGARPRRRCWTKTGC